MRHCCDDHRARESDIVCVRMNSSKPRDQNGGWRACCFLAGLLALGSFTPLVIPMGRSTPTLAGLPYTLWVGGLVSVGFIVLTFVGTRVHPDRESPETWTEPDDR